MQFKVNNKVVMSKIPKWYGGGIKLNEECIITEMGHSFDVIYVQNIKGIKAPVFKSWASPTFKNQQLLFNFMDG